MTSDGNRLRDHLVYLLEGGGAHLSFDQAFGNVPLHLRSARPPGLTCTPWRVLEHMRIAQADILDFCRDPGYTGLPFPEGYWPDGDGPESASDWDESMEAFRRDLQAMVELVRDSGT